MRGDDRFFVDTNVLLYAADPRDRRKQQAAAAWIDLLWQSAAGRLSWQVLHEFYVNAVRKMETPAAKARQTVEALALWQPLDNSLGLIQRAWHWSDEAELSFWDGLIVAAAERSGCAWLLSEDFQSGRRFAGVTVVNPFTAGPEDYGLAPR